MAQKKSTGRDATGIAVDFSRGVYAPGKEGTFAEAFGYKKGEATRPLSVRVGTRRQITIPAAIMKRAGWKVGTALDCSIETVANVGRCIVLRKHKAERRTKR
jgi:hypothetical protein